MRYLLVALLLVGGCSLAPEYHRPDVVAVPEQWVEDPGLTILPVVQYGWWSRFGNAELDSLVETALQKSPQLGMAVASVNKSRAVAGGTSSARWPSVNVGGSSNRSRMSMSQFGMPGSIYNTLYSASATTGYELDLWGRLSDNNKSAWAQVAASELDLQAVRRTLIADVVRTWLEVRQFDGAVQLSEKTVASQKQNLEMVTDRYNSGVVTALDVHLARQALSTSKAVLVVRKSDLLRTKRRLEILCGLYPAGKVGNGNELSELPELVKMPAGLPSELLQNRPDIAASEARLVAAYAQVGASRAGLFPRISLTGEAGGRTGVLSELLDNAPSIWTLAANISMPLLNRGQQMSQVKSAHAGVEQAEANYVRTVLSAFGEVENLLASDEFLQQQRKFVRESVASAENALELSRDRYSRGLGTLMMVLESERRLWQSETELLGVERACRTNRVNLLLALGGSWDTKGEVQ